MAQNVQLPDGTLFPMKEGETPEQALMAAAGLYPDAFTPKRPEAGPKSGGIAALKSGVSSLKEDVAALLGRTGAIAPETAEKYIEEQKQYQARTFKPTETFSEAPLTKFSELLMGSVPYMAAPLVAGTAAATVGPVAALGAAGLASYGQFTGSFLSRQMETGKKLGETELGTAALAALPAAALDTVSLRMIPGIRNLLGSVGKEVTTAEAKALAQQGLGRTFGDYVATTGKVGGVEGLTESAQQFLERLQAGLSISDADARKEYVDSFLGGAVLGGALSVPGRAIERGKIKGIAEKAERDEKAAARAAAEQAKEIERQIEELRKQDPDYMRRVVAESAALEQQKTDLLAQIHKAPKGERLTEEQKQENIVINAQLKELAPKLTEAAKESNRVKPLLARMDAEARLAGMSPEEFMLEQTFRGPGMQVPRGGRFATVPEAEEVAPPEPSAVEQYVTQQTEAAKEAGALTLQDRIDYLMANPIMADQIVKTRTPMPDLSKQDANALYGALELQLKQQARQELAAREAELKGQLPAKPPVGVRKAPDYNAYLETLDELDAARREGDTEAEVRAMEKLRRQTEVIDQGELFGESASKTVLGQAPKTRRELLADLRVARASGDNKAGLEVIDALRKLDDAEASRGKFQTGAAPEFRLTGEQRQRLFESGMTEEQIDETETRAQKALGRGVAAGETPMAVAMQQMASESRAEAFAEIVDLVNRYNKGAAKREQLDAARERLISGLITDIQQTRGSELTDSEKQDITRNAGVLLRELVERFGDTRNLSQKGEDLFVPTQTKEGEFTTGEVPGAGFPTVESQAPGRQTFGSPFAAAQSIREGLEELRTQAIAGDTTQFSRTFTPRTVSADAVETQLARELAKDPKTHSKEQRNLLEAIADNLRMMLRPQTRQDVSDWLYDLARDPKNVAPERTQAVRDALQAVEQAKRSETELETREFAMGKGERVTRAVQPELPLGPGRELRRTELEGPQKPAPAGTFSQISTAPAAEEVQPAVFGSYAELEKYLASDALQQVRSAMGLGMPTLARLQARAAPVMARINAARAQATELSKRAKAIEEQKRAELEALKNMSAKDLAAESQALAQARKTLDDAQRRLAALEGPLRKELEPLIKEFDRAQKQFEAAVAAQEQTMATMLANRQVFENREIAAIEKLHTVQRRMQLARSKIYKAFQEDFGSDPRNLVRMLREFKESGQQGAFNEQLQKAHAELNKVFFDTRKDDAAILRFLKESAKLDSQLAAQNNAIDTLAEKLLNAGVQLEVVRESQVDVAENRDEIVDARAQTEDAKRAVAAIEAKQRERLEEVQKIEDSLGLARREIPHRISEDTTVAEVLYASTDNEKALIQQVQAALDVANESSPAVRALRSFEAKRKGARAAKRETPAQTKARDAQQQRLIEAIGRDPASFEGQRISAEKRRELIEELGATEETREGLEAVIAAADEAIPAAQNNIKTAKAEIKKLDKEIAQLEAKAKKRPRSFIAKLELKSELVGLPALREARERLDAGVVKLTEDITVYEREKATAQSNLETLAARKAELETLFSNDPEIRNAAVAALDKRIAKVEANIKKNAAGVAEKGISKTTRESRVKELRKYKKELRELMTKRSAQFGIKRTELSATGRQAAQPVEAGERLGARKVGPVVAPTRTAGNIRTGEATTTKERKLSTRAKVTQGGKVKETAPIKPVEEADTTEDRILGEMDALEKVRMTVEDRLVDAVADGNTEEAARLRGVRDRIDSQMAEKQAELTAAQKPAKRTKGKPELSRGVPAQGGQSVTELEQSLDRALGEKGLAARRIKLYESVEAFFAGPNKDKYDYDSADIPTDAKAFVNPKTGDVFMFANNIAKNESVGVLLHEVGVHIGFRKLFGVARYNALVQTVKNWAARKDGSLESKIAQRALARVEAAETSAEQVDDELLAYAVEEAVKAGVEPSALKKGSPLQNWLQIVLDTLRKALSAFGIDANKLTSGDLVNMAYGAAQMEVRGTWHGSDAKFTAFDAKKAGQGEGAFDFRFSTELSLGEGPYTTPQQDYAEYYQRAVPFGKAANTTGYGAKSYQDYRALDARFMHADNAQLSPTELRQKFESRLLTAYLQGVNAGGSLDPAANKSAQERLSKLIKNARTPAEKTAVATLDLTQIKGLTQRPAEGQLYAALDELPRSQIFEINRMHKLGDRPKIDALLRKYGDPFEVSEAEQDGSYPGNSLFYGMRQKLGTKETVRLFQDAGIRALEQNTERGRYVERAYIEQAPDVIPLPEKPIGRAKGLLFSRKPQFESENALTELSEKIIAQPKNFKERMGSNLALEAEMNTADMRAAVQEVLKRGAKEMGDDNLFTQAIYNVRKADQFMPQVYTVLTNGPLETYTDEKGLRGIRSSNKDPAVDVITAAAKVPAKNSEGKFALSTTYMIAQRAANKGLSKLDLGELGVTEADLAAAMAAVDADPALKSSLEEVRRRYNAYNAGQIKFLAEMGAIPKATAKEWLKEGDYVPYYRVRDDGTAELVLGGEKTITVGDIRTQPYLAELKGGETKILPLNESLIRNTMLITKAALYNGGTKEFAYAMQEFGKGRGPIDEKTGKAKDAMPIHKGQGPAGTDIIRFNQEPDPSDPKDDGKRWLRIVTKGTAMEGIPAELVVKSLEGAHLTLPAFLKIGGIAGDWLRKGVTRMPPYIFRQLIRDPMAASFTGGLNYGPFRAVVMAGTEFLRSSAGRSEGYKKLIEKGLVQSGVFTGDPDDMSTFATQLASGKDGKVIDRLFGYLDRAAIRADAATRSLVYENALKNGLSEVEADLMTMESMNFYKRGLSPTVQYANRLIPFMNAQIQGLNVLAKAMRGNMPFEERQRIQRKFWNNAVMLFGVGLVYAMAMEDDETFKNAKPRDKYTNFFVNLPGVSEAVKIPLPYESGWFFTAAVALADAMKAETDGKQQLKALKDIFLSSVPGYSSMGVPQAVKPLFEVFTNKNFFSGQNIESASMQNRSPEDRFNASTTEAAKALGKVLPLSPIQIEHIARGYFGTAPLALMSVASGFMREEGKGEAPERRLSETPILGTVFQKKYGGADADTMYAFAKEATQRAASLAELKKTGDAAAAKEYLASHRAEIAMAPMARQFETVMGRIRTQENVVRNRKDLSGEEKRARLDQLDKVRQDVADKFNAAVRRAEAQRASERTRPR